MKPQPLSQQRRCAGRCIALSRAQIPICAHQLREHVDKDGLVYVTWFGAGLRIIDINDPSHPREKGYIIPKPGDGQKAPLTNDIAMDDRGLIYFTDKARGLDVIEFQG